MPSCPQGAVSREWGSVRISAHNYIQRRCAVRAGIEATLSQHVRACGLRRSRHRGLARTHVQHVLTALACNLTRVADWIAEPTTTHRR
jgi:IS5 family transposase